MRDEDLITAVIFGTLTLIVVVLWALDVLT